ncbi:hypothetical protein ACTFIR_003562 [Dictyostelium discoideum]
MSTINNNNNNSDNEDNNNNNNSDNENNNEQQQSPQASLINEQQRQIKEQVIDKQNQLLQQHIKLINQQSQQSNNPSTPPSSPNNTTSITSATITNTIKKSLVNSKTDTPLPTVAKKKNGKFNFTDDMNDFILDRALKDKNPIRIQHLFLRYYKHQVQEFGGILDPVEFEKQISKLLSEYNLKKSRKRSVLGIDKEEEGDGEEEINDYEIDNSSQEEDNVDHDIRSRKKIKSKKTEISKNNNKKKDNTSDIDLLNQKFKEISEKERENEKQIENLQRLLNETNQKQTNNNYLNLNRFSNPLTKIATSSSSSSSTSIPENVDTYFNNHRSLITPNSIIQQQPNFPALKNKEKVEKYQYQKHVLPIPYVIGDFFVKKFDGTFGYVEVLLPIIEQGHKVITQYNKNVSINNNVLTVRCIIHPYDVAETSKFGKHFPWTSDDPLDIAINLPACYEYSIPVTDTSLNFNFLVTINITKKHKHIK